MLKYLAIMVLSTSLLSLGTINEESHCNKVDQNNPVVSYMVKSHVQNKVCK